MNVESIANKAASSDISKRDFLEIKNDTNNNKSSFNPDKRIELSENISDKSSSEYNPDNRINVEDKIKNETVRENDEINNKDGGSYRDVKKNSDGENKEVHHVPADSASYLERDDGPAIKMDKCDHRQTASCGNSKEAREYRNKQKELIDQGRFRDALQMDIDDIHEKFGDKYDKAIGEMLEYVDKIEKEGLING